MLPLTHCWLPSAGPALKSKHCCRLWQSVKGTTVQAAGELDNALHSERSLSWVAGHAHWVLYLKRHWRRSEKGNRVVAVIAFAGAAPDLQVLQLQVGRSRPCCASNAHLQFADGEPTISSKEEQLLRHMHHTLAAVLMQRVGCLLEFEA